MSEVEVFCERLATATLCGRCGWLTHLRWTVQFNGADLGGSELRCKPCMDRDLEAFRAEIGGVVLARTAVHVEDAPPTTVKAS